MLTTTTTTTTVAKKRSASEAQLGSTETPYSYGLFNLPSYCQVLKVDIDGQSDFSNVKMDDVMLISNAVETAAKYITQSQNISKECGIVIKNTTETTGELTLTEYKVLLQFHTDTVIDVQHIAYIQHVNPLRCSGKDSIKVFYDSRNNKMCLMLTIASMLNPIRLTDSVLIHQHFTTMLYTTDQDDSSSKNPLEEVSINRKRARKGDIMYNKIHATK